jgi:hypothetical protein
MRSPTDKALKEWAVVIRALERGDTILLLRKGGIVEEGGRFKVQEPDFLLFPNRTHQNPTQVRLGYHPLLSETEAEPWSRDEVVLTSVAEVADTFVVPDEDAIARLDREHVWSRDYVLERLAYKPEQPLWGVALRVYMLPEPVHKKYLAAYGGCTSWVVLDEPVDVSGARPVLDDQAFASKLARVKSLAGG